MSNKACCNKHLSRCPENATRVNLTLIQSLCHFSRGGSELCYWPIFICLRQLGACTQSSQPGSSRENPYHHTRCRILFAFVLIWDVRTNIQLLQIQKPGGDGSESESCHVTHLLASCSWDWAGWGGTGDEWRTHPSIRAPRLMWEM